MQNVTTTFILAIVPLVLIQVALMVLGYVDLFRRERVRGGAPGHPRVTESRSLSLPQTEMHP